MYLDLTRADLGHGEYEDLWGTVYAMDRMAPPADPTLEAISEFRAGLLVWFFT